MKPDIEYLDLGSWRQQTQRLSYPIGSGGFPSEEKYQNNLVEHLISRLNSKKNSLKIADFPQGLQLKILFVKHPYGLNATGRFDDFGSRTRLSSPWVRVTTRDWAPCSMQVIFFKQGRQIVRDQMEMHAGKRIKWKSHVEYSEQQMRWFSNEYRHRMLDYNAKFSNKEAELIKLRQDMPPDIIVWAINSPRNMQSAFSIGFNVDAVPYIYDGYTRNSIQTLDRLFDNENHALHIRSVLDNDFNSSKYMHPNFQI